METKAYAVNVKALSAIQYFAAKKDIRHYLNGVHVKIGPYQTIYEASDGHALGRYTDVRQNEHTGEFLIPIDTVSQLKVREKSNPGLLMVDDVNNARIINPSEHQDFGFRCIEGKFPDVARHIPSETSNTPGHYDVELLVKFMKANKVFGSKKPGNLHIQQNGETGVAIVKFPIDPAFLGIIMPFRV
jgi:DNA polymerase-3 subunit beta